jgi:hypothetical protein
VVLQNRERGKNTRMKMMKTNLLPANGKDYTITKPSAKNNSRKRKRSFILNQIIKLLKKEDVV